MSSICFRNGSGPVSPRDFLRFLVIGWTRYVTLAGAGSREQSFELHRGDYIGMVAKPVKIEFRRVIGGKPRSKNHRADVEIQKFALFFMGFQRDGAGAAGIHALITFAAVAAVQAAMRFGLSGLLGKPQLDFVEIAFPGFRF